jgi:hypothetical protein
LSSAGKHDCRRSLETLQRAVMTASVPVRLTYIRELCDALSRSIKSAFVKDPRRQRMCLS